MESSAPLSARSCSSMNSDISDDAHDRLLEGQHPVISSSNKRGHSNEQSEDYLDMVLDNFFDLHHEIDGIESSLTGDSPKVSPRPEEYVNAAQSQALHGLENASQVIADDTRGQIKRAVEKAGLAGISDASTSKLSMRMLEENGRIQLVPANASSRDSLKSMYDRQLSTSSGSANVQKKVLNFNLQVSMEIFEEVAKPPEPEPKPKLEAVSMPPPQSLLKLHKNSSKKHSKDKDRDSRKKKQVMRHVYKTKCNAFRVQISVGSKVNPNGKFSRNAREEKDALWLCELAILFVHRPSSIDYLFQWGNYDYLIANGHCKSFEDYEECLVQEFVQLTGRGLIKPAEFEILKIVIPDFFPTVGDRVNALDLSHIASPEKNKKVSTPSNKSAPKSKVDIPALPLSSAYTNSFNQTSISDSGAMSNTYMKFEKQFQQMQHQQQHHQHMFPKGNEYDSGYREGDVDPDTDSKRRRVPSMNPTHQSPRTLDIIRQQISGGNA